MKRANVSGCWRMIPYNAAHANIQALITIAKMEISFFFTMTFEEAFCDRKSPRFLSRYRDTPLEIIPTPKLADYKFSR